MNKIFLTIACLLFALQIFSQDTKLFKNSKIQFEMPVNWVEFKLEGQEVIILDPSYDCYEPAVILSGGTPIRIALNTDFTPNWENIEAAFSDKTAMIIINNPHNPSGRILHSSDIEKLEEILEKYPKTLLMSDEVYEYITFEEEHSSKLSYLFAIHIGKDTELLNQ